MTEPPFDPSDLTVTSVPVPDHLASGQDETPPPSLDGVPTETPSGGEVPKRRRRLIGTPPPGSRDSGTRRDRKIPKDKGPLPPIPRNGFAPGIEKMYAGLALAVMPIDVELASAIMQIAPEAAKAWDDLARQNETVRRVLVRMMQTTAAGAVVAAHVPLIILLFNRMAKGDPRISMLGAHLASDAERHANGETSE